MAFTPERIIWHHSASAGSGHQAAAINTAHQERGFPLSKRGFYGGYHLLIEKDGTIFRYRNDDEIGAHTLNNNPNSLGICLAGNFDTELPTQEQAAALAIQLRFWTTKYNISLNNIFPHRHFNQTACPGGRLADDWAKQQIGSVPASDEKAFLNGLISYIQSRLDKIA